MSYYYFISTIAEYVWCDLIKRKKVRPRTSRQGTHKHTYTHLSVFKSSQIAKHFFFILWDLEKIPSLIQIQTRDLYAVRWQHYSPIHRVTVCVLKITIDGSSSFLKAIFEPTPWETQKMVKWMHILDESGTFGDQLCGVLAAVVTEVGKQVLSDELLLSRNV